jgi:hypothetical protein
VEVGALEVAGFDVAGLEVAGLEVAGLEVAGLEVAGFDVGAALVCGGGVVGGLVVVDALVCTARDVEVVEVPGVVLPDVVPADPDVLTPGCTPLWDVLGDGGAVVGFGVIGGMKTCGMAVAGAKITNRMSSSLKLANGWTTAVCVAAPGVVSTEMTLPTGTFGT